MPVAVNQIKEPAASQEAAPCPLCRSAANRIARVDCGDGRSARVCDSCGFLFIWPRIEQDFSLLPEQAYYGDWQLLDLDSIAGLYADVIAERARLAGLPRVFGQSLSIIDIGCGAGHVLPHFPAHGWKVQGVDPWAAVAEIGRKYYRLPIETARIENAASVKPASQDAALSIDR